jgi:hypothetical protein
MDDHAGTLAFQAPDPTQNGLEPDAVLILAPQFDLLLRMGLLQGLDGARKVFLNAA